MKIGAVYDATASVSSHAPGTCVAVSFPTWLVGQAGVFPVTCSTELAGDMVSANDRQTDIIYVITDTIWVPEPSPPLGERGKDHQRWRGDGQPARQRRYDLQLPAQGQQHL